MNGKTKVVATLATAGVLVLAPVTAQLEGNAPSIQAGDAQASAATIDVLKDSKLEPVYENGKLKLTLTGKQLAHVGLIANYYTYFALPPELAQLLDNPNVRANTTLSYDIPVLSIGSIGVPSNQGSVTGDELTLDKEHQAIGAKIHHGLASVGVGATNTYTLTIDLANLGISSLPSSEDGQLNFAAMSSDEDIDLNLLGNQNAAQSTLETSQPDGVKPVIKADDQELSVGDTFQPKEGVTATDDRDGDVTNEVEVVENNVDTSKAGTYQVTYQVTDQAGNIATKTITVTVEADEWQDFQVGNVTQVDSIAPEARTIEGETDYRLNSVIPKGTKIYANAVLFNEQGLGQDLGRVELNYDNKEGIGSFTIPVNNPDKLQAGMKVGIYLSAENGEQYKDGKVFETQVSSFERTPF